MAVLDSGIYNNPHWSGKGMTIKDCMVSHIVDNTIVSLPLLNVLLSSLVPHSSGDVVLYLGMVEWQHLFLLKRSPQRSCPLDCLVPVISEGGHISHLRIGGLLANIVTCLCCAADTRYNIDCCQAAGQVAKFIS